MKIHLKVDLGGLPFAFHFTGGEASDSRNFEILLDSGEAARGFLFLELDLGIAKLKPIKFFAALSMSGAKKLRLRHSELRAQECRGRQIEVAQRVFPESHRFGTGLPFLPKCARSPTKR